MAFKKGRQKFKLAPNGGGDVLPVERDFTRGYSLLSTVFGDLNGNGRDEVYLYLDFEEYYYGEFERTSNYGSTLVIEPDARCKMVTVIELYHLNTWSQAGAAGGVYRIGGCQKLCVTCVQAGKRPSK